MAKQLVIIEREWKVLQLCKRTFPSLRKLIYFIDILWLPSFIKDIINKISYLTDRLKQSSELGSAIRIYASILEIRFELMDRPEFDSGRSLWLSHNLLKGSCNCVSIYQIIIIHYLKLVKPLRLIWFKGCRSFWLYFLCLIFKSNYDSYF